MAIYRSVQVSFWQDAKVVDEFTPEDRYFYLYLITNTHTNLCGCYEISVSQMAYETGYNKDTIERLIKRFEEVHKVIRYNKETKEILLLNWNKYNWQGGKQLKPMSKEISGLKCKTFRDILGTIYNEKFEEYPIEGVSETHTYPIEATVTVSVTDTVSDSDTGTVKEGGSRGRKKFVAPTWDDIADYCNSNGLFINVDEFLDYYSSQGWKLSNGNAMKDWKAAVRRWARRSESKKPQEKKKGGLFDDIDITGVYE